MYFLQFFKLDNHIKDEITTTIITTTKNINNDYTKLTIDKKIKFNEYLNNEIILKSFNNAINNNFNIYDINLIQTEISKFKFIYTYLKLNEIDNNIKFEIINEYSNRLFKTDLYEPNLLEYLIDENYIYEVNDESPSFCLKAKSEKGNIILFDMILKDEVSCNNNTIEYDNSTIINQVKLEYELVDDKMIYKSFVIIK